MSEEQAMTAGRRRSRGAQDTARAGALERLKALRSGGRRSTEAGSDRFQVKIEDPIYDTIDENEYEALVAKRRESVKEFIVDDDGLGYGDEGEEVDWSIPGARHSSDESEGETERVKRKKKNKSVENGSLEKEQQNQATKKPSALSAAAALMGKQRISSMFTSSIFKKNKDDSKGKNLSCDSIVDDVIAEFAPDEADRDRRRRGNSNLASHVKNFSSAKSPIAYVKAESPAIGNVNVCFEEETKGLTDSINEPVPAEFLTTEVSVEKDLHWENAEFREDKLVDVSDCSRKEKSVIEEQLNVLEVEAKPAPVKVEEMKTFKLNAKINEEKGSMPSATAGWQAVRSTGNGAENCDNPETNHSFNCEDKTDIEVDSDGSMPFYILDAYEEIYGANAGIIYLFGKVKSGGTYQSCCVVVKNMHRCVYAIPTVSVFRNDRTMILEKEVEMSQISSSTFRTELHEMASGLKSEITAELLKRNVSSFSMAPVKRNYAFERSDIPHGEAYVLKISYPFKDPPLPSDLRGENFVALLGTHSSALETFLVKRRIKGPSWLSISKFSSCPAPQRVSWCKFEVLAECPKDIHISTSSKNTAEIPPIVITAINLKTIINEKQNANEIVSASVICCHKAKIDVPMLASEWTRQGMLSHFTVIRKLDGGIFPMGFTKEATERNSKSGHNVISFETSERALLNRLMIELHKLDSDVLIGHNISGFDLDVLLHRFQVCKVPSSMWSKIGRLKRSVMPKLNKGSHIFGSGATPGILLCIAGRLLCDTFLSSRDLLKEGSFSLTQLAKTQLNKDRKEIAPNDIPLMFQTSESLMELIEYGETDAYLSMELMFHFSILPLTRQLTNISGNLWGKTLQVNKKYRCLEIDLDGLYKRMLLLKKKKYAAVKMQFKDRTTHEAIERKGLDMVCRDWSLLSKELGDFCLSQILSGGSCEDVVESIHNSLTKVQEDMRNGQIAPEKYIITKTLTKAPEAYPDGKSQPHVQVAIWMRRNGYVTGCSAGDTVPYIICCEQDTGSSSSVGIAQRARHPDELKQGNTKWIVDIDYYLAQQILPVVSRLCAPIQGTSPARLADCMGLDSTKQVSAFVDDQKLSNAKAAYMKGCFSSTAIMALSEENFYVLAYESRLSLKEHENAEPQIVNDFLDKLIPIHGSIFMAGTGKTENFLMVQKRLPLIWKENVVVTPNTTMDQIAAEVVKIVNDIMFPMGPDGIDFREQHLLCNRVKFILIGSIGLTHGIYVIRKKDDINEYFLER